jgi:hypothetical protein
VLMHTTSDEPDAQARYAGFLQGMQVAGWEMKLRAGCIPGALGYDRNGLTALLHVGHYTLLKPSCSLLLLAMPNAITRLGAVRGASLRDPRAKQSLRPFVERLILSVIRPT